MKILGCTLALVALPVSHALGDVLDVGGPSPDAATIGAAVALANEGDVIRVYAGTYPGFTVSGKSLSIVPNAAGVQPRIQGTVRVENLVAGQSLVLVGIRAEGTHPDPALLASNCVGAIRVENCEFVGLPSSYTLFKVSTGILNACDDVVITDTSFVGTRGSSGFESGLDADGGDGGVALEIQSSTAALCRSSMTGGNGGEANFCCFVGHTGGDGGHAILVGGATQLFLSTCILAGGEFGYDDYVIYFGHGFAGIGVYAVGTASGLLQVKNSVIPGTQVGASFVVSNLLGTQPRLSGPSLITDIENLPIVIHGDPGSRVGLFFSSGYDHQILVGDGPLLVSIPTGFDRPMWLNLGVMGPTGVMTRDLGMRDLPAFAHTTLHLVAATVQGSVRHYSNGLSPVVLDTAW